MPSAHDLVERGLLLDAARLIDQDTAQPLELAAMRARLECFVGSLSRAESSAQQLLRERLGHRDRAICWETLGRVALNNGKTSDGHRAMAKAFEAAATLQDARFEARLAASYTESLLHCVHLSAAAIEIPRLRHAATRAGDAFSLVEFHCLSAELNAKSGLLPRTALCIETASALLSRYPNVVQKGRLANIASALAEAQSDYDSAMNSATEALECGRTSGVRTIRLPALNNIVCLKLAQRQFDDARPYLDELFRELLDGNPTEIAYRDTQMMLALAADDAETAAVAAQRVADLTANQVNRDAYYEQWYLPNHVRWRYRIGDVSTGVRLATEGIDPRTPDQRLLARLRFLAADGLGRIDQSDSAMGHWLDATRSLRDPSLELFAESLRVAGRLTAATDSLASRHYFDQASSVLHGIGNLALEADVDRDANNTLGPAWRNRRTDAAAQNLLAQHVARLTTFLELGAHPPTLASACISLIADSGIARKCVLSEAGTANGRHSVDTICIDLGSHRAKPLQIVVRPQLTAAARASVAWVERLAHAALEIAKSRQLEREKTAAVFSEQTTEQQLGLICSSERMLELLKTLRLVAASNTTILLTGETGVGKELFAKAVHQSSPRSDKVFLPFNCSTVPRDMFDSQLFGHKRGSFTGAIDESKGVIRAAAGGTLFLDEIGEMAVETQPKLLRFLESGEVMPLGESKPQHVDVRIVAATNANLDQLVAEGRFREDLYYRLNVIRINIPPLRERREEIPALVEHFLEQFGRELHKPMLRVADETLEYLVLYRWPGNVRQLANEIRRLVAMAEPASVIMPAHLSDDIAESRRTLPAHRSARLFDEVVTRIDQPLSAAVEHIERAAIQRALSMTDGRLDEAARMLGVSRKGLYLKRQRLNLG